MIYRIRVSNFTVKVYHYFTKLNDLYQSFTIYAGYSISNRSLSFLFQVRATNHRNIRIDATSKIVS